MSLYVWYENEPCEPKYLQISHHALGQFCKANKIDFDVFRGIMHDHHAQPVTKDGMFILERFFSGKVLDVVAQYLTSKGYKVVDNYEDLEGESMIEGYDGILINWCW